MGGYSIIPAVHNGSIVWWLNTPLGTSGPSSLDDNTLDVLAAWVNQANKAY